MSRKKKCSRCGAIKRAIYSESEAKVKFTCDCKSAPGKSVKKKPWIPYKIISGGAIEGNRRRH